MANNTQISQILRRLRDERKISQKNVALNLGVSQALLSHYEKGIRECGLDFLIRAAKYYGVTTDYLLGVTDDNIKNICAESNSNANTAEPVTGYAGTDINIDADLNVNYNGSEIESENVNINVDNKEGTYNAYPGLYKNLLVKLINYIFGGFERMSNSAPEYKSLTKTSGEYMLLSVYSLYKYLFDGECPSRSSFEIILSTQLKLADKLQSDIKQQGISYERDLLAANDYIRFMITNSEKIIAR